MYSLEGIPEVGNEEIGGVKLTRPTSQEEHRSGTHTPPLVNKPVAKRSMMSLSLELMAPSFSLN